MGFGALRCPTMPPSPATNAPIHDLPPLPAALERVPAHRLHERIGAAAPLALPAATRAKSLGHWNMDEDDAPILQYLFRQLQPRRHLEFGTWIGLGTTRVLESCDAEVWTLNLPEGERNAEGKWLYAQPVARDATLPPEARHYTNASGERFVITDGPGYIGKCYRERGLAHRVHQILCDSRAWDTRDYPADFFDTALIDGGHTAEVVANDTDKALSLVRPGGAILWHDFCPDDDVRRRCPCVRGVTAAIAGHWATLTQHCRALFWIEPSWLLMGIRR